jgi:pectinesterase
MRWNGRTVERWSGATAFALGALLSSTTVAHGAPDALVSPEASAQYHSIQDAINAAPQDIVGREWVIHVAPGVYKERVYVQREKHHVVLEGASATTTKLTFSLNADAIGPDGRKISTFRTPTLQIDADDFRVVNLAVENAAGPGSQALALRVDGDRVTFRDCHFIGWQDTIFLNRNRQYFERCRIDGAVDFIFGGSTAYFNDCEIVCVGGGYITAASTPREQAFGFVFDRCTIRGADASVRTFLGRPWRVYAATIFLNCDLGPVIREEGWNDWSKPAAHSTMRYATSNNRGSGAQTSHWPAWVRQLSAGDASAITRQAVLGGADGWSP